MTVAKNPRNYVQPDARSIQHLRAAGPSRPRTNALRVRAFSRVFPNSSRFTTLGCGYCTRTAKVSRVVVNPITLRRTHEPLCGRSACEAKLRAWSDRADARRRRAQLDWERENPTASALDLVHYIPPQFPSVSRATLRAFLDSGEPMATVKRANGAQTTASGLNSSIRSLGFADEVYAEIRSGEVVLRRTAVSA